MKFYIELSLETVFPLSDFIKVLFFFHEFVKIYSFNLYEGKYIAKVVHEMRHVFFC